MDEMRVEVGAKESSKKKLVWSCRNKMAESSAQKMEAKKTEIAMEDCIKSDLERVGEE